MLYTADGKRKTTLSHGDEVVVYRGNSLEIIRDQIPISFGLTLQFKVNDQKNDKLYIGKHSQDCFVFVCQCLAIFYHLRFETRDFLDLGPLRSSISLVDDFCNPIVIFLVGKKKTKICSGDQVILDIDGNVFLYRPLLELPLKIGFPVNYLHNGKEDLT